LKKRAESSAAELAKCELVRTKLSEWDTQKQFRKELQDKPSELKRYEDKLKETIMMRNRSDTYHRKGKKASAYKLDRKCENLCEDALERMPWRFCKKLLLLMLACRCSSIGTWSLVTVV